MKSLSNDAVGGVDGLAFTGVRDGDVDGTAAGAEILAVLDDGHTVTNGPNLVVRVTKLDEGAH